MKIPYWLNLDNPNLVGLLCKFYEEPEDSYWKAYSVSQWDGQDFLSVCSEEYLDLEHNWIKGCLLGVNFLDNTFRVLMPSHEVIRVNRNQVNFYPKILSNIAV